MSASVQIVRLSAFADASDELTFVKDLSRREPQNRLHDNHDGFWLYGL